MRPEKYAAITPAMGFLGRGPLQKSYCRSPSAWHAAIFVYVTVCPVIELLNEPQQRI